MRDEASGKGWLGFCSYTCTQWNWVEGKGELVTNAPGSMTGTRRGRARLPVQVRTRSAVDFGDVVDPRL